MWGPVVLVLSLLGYGWLLGRIRARSQAEDEKPWWLGYSRDGSNLLALGAATVGLIGVGFPPPLALLAAFLLVLVVYLADYWLGRGLHRPVAGWLAAALGIGLAGLIMIAPTPVIQALAQVLAKLF